MKLEHEVSFPVADDLAFYGLAGDIIRMTEPLTEAHPMALVVQIRKRGTKYISTVQRPIVKNVVGADDK